MDYDFSYRIEAVVEKGLDRSGWVLCFWAGSLKIYRFQK